MEEVGRPQDDPGVLDTILLVDLASHLDSLLGVPWGSPPQDQPVAEIGDHLGVHPNLRSAAGMSLRLGSHRCGTGRTRIRRSTTRTP